jgi:hypothetical protein
MARMNLDLSLRMVSAPSVVRRKCPSPSRIPSTNLHDHRHGQTLQTMTARVEAGTRFLASVCRQMHEAECYMRSIARMTLAVKHWYSRCSPSGMLRDPLIQRVGCIACILFACTRLSEVEFIFRSKLLAGQPLNCA